MENKMMVMRRALRDVSRVAEEMTRGTMTGEDACRYYVRKKEGKKEGGAK
jgi:hypothetical protein